MSNRLGVRWARNGTLLLGIVLLAVMLVQNLLNPEYGWGDAVFFGVLMLYFLTLGFLLLRRRPDNRIAWLFVVLGLAIGLSGVIGARADEQHLLETAISSAFWMLWLSSLPLLFLWFPTGRPPNRRWWLVEKLVFGVVAVVALGTLLADQVCLEGDGGSCLLWGENPIGIPGVPWPEYSPFLGPIFAAVIIGSLASLVFRYRRAGHVERLQLKWFLLAACLLIFSIAMESGYDAVLSEEPPGWVSVVNAIGVMAIPVAATIAILRYRLYEIDRIVSRTVTYAVVAGLLAGAVAVVAALVGTRFSDPVVVAATTLGVAAAFNPVRRRVRLIVDRRFNRSRYDAEQVASDFAETLRDRIDPDVLIAGWRDVVLDTMHPRSAGVWVKRQ